MWDKLGATIGLLIGICLIIFRKIFAGFIIQKQLEERATPKRKKYHQQLKEMKIEGILHKGLEVAAILVGVGFVLINIPEFLPQAKKFVAYLLGFFVLSFLAAGAAVFVELITIFRFLWRNVRKYTRERYPDWSCNVKSSSGSDKLNAVSSGPIDDPVLQALQKKATIYSIISFVVLFAIFLVAFYIIFRLSS